LPAELLDADRAYQAVLAGIRFSEHLNPVNIAAARKAFFAGAKAPPFEYAPATWAADAKAQLAAIRVPMAHPLGVALSESMAETVALIHALDRRDAEAFRVLAELSDWLPSAADDGEIPATPPSGPVAAQISAERMFTALRDSLRQRELHDWEVTWDNVLSSRLLVDAPRKAIRVNPTAHFTELDRVGMVAHEVDVHVTRSDNGTRQPLALFSTGLARSLLAEEGLAVAAEEEARAMSPGFEARQALMIRAVRLAEGCGFRQLFQELVPLAGSNAAFQLALRVKRGLSDPGLPGCYAKDSVYLRGWRKVRAWRAAGGDIAHLYVGKVGFDQPIQEWIEAGWLVPRPVPRMWSRWQA
jgi:hypothetical protein